MKSKEKRKRNNEEHREALGALKWNNQRAENKKFDEWVKEKWKKFLKWEKKLNYDRLTFKCQLKPTAAIYLQNKFKKNNYLMQRRVVKRNKFFQYLMHKDRF